VGGLIQNVFLSDFMILLVMIVVLSLITSWAFRLREFAGYALGWLVGIFAIILLSTLLSQPTPDPTLPPQPERIDISFASLFFPSIIGFPTGFFLMMLLNSDSTSRTRTRQALMMAVLLTIALSTSYVMFIASLQLRSLTAVFLLTFGIGALLHYIVTRRRWMATTGPLTQQRYIPYNSDVEVPNGEEPPVAVVDLPPSVTDRLRSIRNRVRR
jgi:hypothetical protein